MTHDVSGRRQFLRQTALSSLGLTLMNAENNLAFSQATQTVDTAYIIKPLRPEALTMEGISRRTMEEHHKLYAGYVGKANEILSALKSVDYSKSNQTYSQLRELKVELSFAVGGIKNHELYFDVLGGKGGKPSGALLDRLASEFNSYEEWEKDFAATGLAARGWVWLAYDRDRKRLFNYLGDAQNTYPIWNAVPLLALDTYEHAYYLDYATDRKSYITAFMRLIDWNVVEKRFTSGL